MGEMEDTALHEAVRYGDEDEVRSALREGLDPNQIGLYEWSALHEAANNGDAGIIKLLLKYEGKYLIKSDLVYLLDLSLCPDQWEVFSWKFQGYFQNHEH